MPDILPTQGAGATQITALEAAARIEDNYLRVRKEKSDINEHLGTLRDLARDSTHVAELGVRTMVSTWALLQVSYRGERRRKFEIAYLKGPWCPHGRCCR